MVMINQAMAHQYWPNSDPLNDRLIIGKGVSAAFDAERVRGPNDSSGAGSLTFGSSGGDTFGTTVRIGSHHPKGHTVHHQGAGTSATGAVRSPRLSGRQLPLLAPRARNIVVNSPLGLLTKPRH